jgi:putative molybdopterin biosynthesis protein
MAKTHADIVSHVKQYRLRAGLSQSQMAELAGVKRQAIYDIESGRYLPNTAVALRLARSLGCRVEDLFTEKDPAASHPVVMAEGEASGTGRVSVVKIRGQMVGYPVDGVFALDNVLRAADGVLEGGRVRLLAKQAMLDSSILLTGCDPAFSLLAAHVGRVNPKMRVLHRFASSHLAMDRLSRGMAHIAGTHLHNAPNEEANVQLAREKLTPTGAMVVGFSLMEEGFMVPPGNPAKIRSAADLAPRNIRLVNREQGAALRVLLDDELARAGIPTAAVSGYDREVLSHNQGAQMVASGAADAALGLHAIARFYELDFVPITEVRCDLVIPADLMDNPVVQLILEIVQTRRLRDELASVPGYSCNKTGDVIATF